MSKKKGNSPQNQQPLSPKKYIMTKARGLPIYKCLVNDNWREELLAQVVVTRKHTNGNITGGIYIVDMADRGLDDAVVVFNKPEEEFFEVLTRDATGYEFMEITYELAHNIIFQAMDFSEDMGYNPKKKLDLGEYILEEDNEEIDFIYIPFGEEANSELINNVELDKYYSFNEQEWKEFLKDKKEEITDASSFIDPLFEFIVNKRHPELKEEELPFNVSEIKFLEDEKMIGEFCKTTREKEIVDEFLTKINNENTDFEEFETVMEKYTEEFPQNPMLKSFLATVILQNEDVETYKEIHQELLSKFPDYAHSKFMLAYLYLDESNLDEFKKLIPAPFTPSIVFPGKTLFFYTDILALISAVIRYAVKVDDLKLALLFENILEDFSLLVEDVFLLQSNELLEIAMEEYNEKKVLVCKEFVEQI